MAGGLHRGSRKRVTDIAGPGGAEVKKGSAKRPMKRSGHRGMKHYSLNNYYQSRGTPVVSEPRRSYGQFRQQGPTQVAPAPNTGGYSVWRMTGIRRPNRLEARDADFRSRAPITQWGVPVQGDLEKMECTVLGIVLCPVCLDESATRNDAPWSFI